MNSIVISGDFVGTNRVQAFADEKKFDELLGETKALFQDFDYRMVNLESPVASSTACAITKCGPSLKCNEQAVGLLKFAGFDGVTLANNHFYDYGEEGVQTTIQSLSQHQIDHVGGGRNLEEASATLYKKINGDTVAFINCTEHEFSIATQHSGGSNPLNPISQYHAIREARAKADYVIVITHGGIEGYDKPTPRMQETYRFFIEVGADAVVNHHQHCPSGYEVYLGKPIFYGLGNFCFDIPSYEQRPWNKGYAVVLLLDDGQVSFRLLPYVQCQGRPGVRFLQGAEKDDFLKEIEQLNAVIAQPSRIAEAHEAFMDATSAPHGFLFLPFGSRIAESLFDRRLLPLCYAKNKWPLMLNKIECESHRERLIHFIKKKLR